VFAPSCTIWISCVVPVVVGAAVGAAGGVVASADPASFFPPQAATIKATPATIAVARILKLPHIRLLVASLPRGSCVMLPPRSGPWTT